MITIHEEALTFQEFVKTHKPPLSCALQQYEWYVQICTREPQPDYPKFLQKTKQKEKRRRQFYVQASKLILNSKPHLEATHCFYCGSKFDKSDPCKIKTYDHVVPYSAGGKNKLTNIVPCCQSCNCSKNYRELHQWLKLSRPLEIHKT